MHWARAVMRDPEDMVHLPVGEGEAVKEREKKM